MESRLVDNSDGNHRIVIEESYNGLVIGAFGSIMSIASGIPSLIFNFVNLLNTMPSDMLTWSLILFVGSILRIVSSILLGYGLMTLMKNHGNSYGLILFIIVLSLPVISLIYPGYLPGFHSGYFYLGLSIFFWSIIAYSLWSIRSKCAKPGLAGTIAVVSILNPLNIIIFGILYIIESDIFFWLDIVTGIGISFITDFLFFYLFYIEAGTVQFQDWDW